MLDWNIAVRKSQHLYFYLSMLSLWAFHSSASAQTEENFRDKLALCAAGAKMNVAPEIIDSFSTLYKERSANGPSVITLGDFLSVIPPKQQIQALDLYNQCATGQGGIKRQIVELPANLVTDGASFKATASDIVANSSTIRSFSRVFRAEDGAKGQDGSNGRNGDNGAGGRGADGSAGQQGGEGRSGDSANSIQIEGDSFVGHLVIDNSGANGGNGGSGGRGGIGGAGGRGSSAITGVFDCRSGPGNGGGGGNGGNGGDAGRGGNGGDGGPVIVRLKSVAPGSTISIVSKGGVGGGAGSPGLPGTPGIGGPPGETRGLCSGGGRGAGAIGASGTQGRTAEAGKEGRAGQIEVTIDGKTVLATGEYRHAP
ncbi:hypothetical protein LKMONMHP_2398 [Methylobacterium organophilum]|uniref:Collagen-like protein n=1 Tax=Methylobacterium organophilum TaxID=410 RepID=A0ABQ4T891_METOR|nr:hypothetical protein LKMONMHP_2398 [Methylobacterium organophilum]